LLFESKEKRGEMQKAILFSESPLNPEKWCNKLTPSIFIPRFFKRQRVLCNYRKKKLRPVINKTDIYSINNLGLYI